MPDPGLSIKENLRRIRERVTRAADAAGRDPDEVTIVTVSKFAGADAVRAAYEAGCRDFGENRIQECAEKILSLRSDLPEAHWHMIGHLQSNKVKKALELFDFVQSVDSLKLAREINRRAAEAERRVDILVEVNSSGETQKHGLPTEEAPELIDRLSELSWLNTRGLMTLGPHTEDEAAIRKSFSSTRELLDTLREGDSNGAASGELGLILSMGMSGDFEIAIAEGSTMVRIGTAIFGPRSYT